MPFDEDNSYKERLSGVVGFDPIGDSEELARPGPKSAAQTPAPPKERIKGSRENPEGTASTRSKAGDIEISEANEQALKDKIAEFIKEHPQRKVPSLGTLKKVFRRGAGAFSTSFRPTISGGKPNSRNAWAMARVNKFLKMAGGGEVKESYRKADGDLLEERFEDCGTGAGGFQPGNTCAGGGGGKETQSIKINTKTESNKAESAINEISRSGWEKSAESFYIKRYKEGNVEIEIKPSFKDTLRISNIQVDKNAMGRGLGSRALKEITDAADKNNLTITAKVKPSGVGGLSKDQLHKWYASYGFKRKPFALQPNKLSDEIIREPKTK